MMSSDITGAVATLRIQELQRTADSWRTARAVQRSRTRKLRGLTGRLRRKANRWA